MIWLAWRQFRTPALAVFVALAAVAVAFVVTGPTLVHLSDTVVARCATARDCGQVTSAFLGRDRFLQYVSQDVVVVPALIGIFLGAPLVARELETGSWRLAWTQSVTRVRWMVVKLALVGGASMVAAGLLTLMVTWWSSPFDALGPGPFSRFDQRGIVPIAYAAFAFALGVTLGVLIRRTIPAMVATLVVYATVLLVVTSWVRPRYLPPLHQTSALDASGTGVHIPGASAPGSWILSSTVIDQAGRVVGQDGGIGQSGGIGFRPGADGVTTFIGVGRCPNTFPAPSARFGSGQPSSAMQRAVATCINSFHLRELATYQPGSRYWPFQWYESALFMVLALGLAAFSIWWVRRRLT